MKCENCNKEHDGSYGSGRFCSKHCRCSYIAKQVKHRCTEKPNSRSPYGTWQCTKCKLIFNTRKQLTIHIHQVHPQLKEQPWNKGLSKKLINVY